MAAAGVLFAACSDSAEPGDPSSAGSAGSAATCSGEFDEYAPGMSKEASPGALTLRLADANPAPPGFGTNAWILLVPY